MLYLSAFLSLSGGDNFPKTGSKNAPGDAPGSLARVSNVYCLVFGEPLVFGEAALDRPDRRSAGLSAARVWQRANPPERCSDASSRAIPTHVSSHAPSGNPFGKASPVSRYAMMRRVPIR